MSLLNSPTRRLLENGTQFAKNYLQSSTSQFNLVQLYGGGGGGGGVHNNNSNSSHNRNNPPTMGEGDHQDETSSDNDFGLDKPTDIAAPASPERRPATVSTEENPSWDVEESASSSFLDAPVEVQKAAACWVIPPWKAEAAEATGNTTTTTFDENGSRTPAATTRHDTLNNLRIVDFTPQTFAAQMAQRLTEKSPSPHKPPTPDYIIINMAPKQARTSGGHSPHNASRQQLQLPSYQQQTQHKQPSGPGNSPRQEQPIHSSHVKPYDNKIRKRRRGLPSQRHDRPAANDELPFIIPDWIVTAPVWLKVLGAGGLILVLASVIFLGIYILVPNPQEEAGHPPQQLESNNHNPQPSVPSFQPPPPMPTLYPPSSPASPTEYPSSSLAEKPTIAPVTAAATATASSTTAATTTSTSTSSAATTSSTTLATTWPEINVEATALPSASPSHLGKIIPIPASSTSPSLAPSILAPTRTWIPSTIPSEAPSAAVTNALLPLEPIISDTNRTTTTSTWATTTHATTTELARTNTSTSATTFMATTTTAPSNSTDLDIVTTTNATTAATPTTTAAIETTTTTASTTTTTTPTMTNRTVATSATTTTTTAATTTATPSATTMPNDDTEDEGTTSASSKTTSASSMTTTTTPAVATTTTATTTATRTTSTRNGADIPSGWTTVLDEQRSRITSFPTFSPMRANDAPSRN